MIKKTITYTDYDGNERTEEFFFHLTPAEATIMNLEMPGGVAKNLERIANGKNGQEMVNVFKDLILRSYGVKSPDGRRFIKNDEVRSEFEQTEAFSVLFMELVSDSEKASEFFNGVIPHVDEAEPANPVHVEAVVK